MTFTRHMGSSKWHITLAIMWSTAQAVLFLLGAWFTFFGVVCYLGGPDPRPGDLHLHLIFGTLYSGIGVALVFGGRKAGRQARNHFRQRNDAANQASESTR